MQHSGEKTEKATPHRLLKARREGKFASSKDFVSGLQFTVFVILLVESGQQLLGNLKQASRTVFSAGVSSGPEPRGADRTLAPSFRADHVSAGSPPAAFWCSPAWLFSSPPPGFGMSLQGLVPKASNFSVISKLKSAPQKGFASAIQAVALLACSASPSIG